MFVVNLQIRNAEPGILPIQQFTANILKRIAYKPTNMLIAQHGVSLPRGGLPVHEDSAISGTPHELSNYAPAAVLVDFLIALGRPESMVVGKLVSVGLLQERNRLLFLQLAALEGVINVDVLAQGRGRNGGGDGTGLWVDLPHLLVLEQVQQGAHPHCHLDGLGTGLGLGHNGYTV